MTPTMYVLAFTLVAVFALAGRSLQLQHDLNKMIAVSEEMEEDLTRAEDSIGAILTELESVGVHVTLPDMPSGYYPVWAVDDDAA